MLCFDAVNQKQRDFVTKACDHFGTWKCERKIQQPTQQGFFIYLTVLLIRTRWVQIFIAYSLDKKFVCVVKVIIIKRSYLNRQRPKFKWFSNNLKQDMRNPKVVRIFDEFFIICISKAIRNLLHLLFWLVEREMESGLSNLWHRLSSRCSFQPPRLGFGCRSLLGPQILKPN